MSEFDDYRAHRESAANREGADFLDRFRPQIQPTTGPATGTVPEPAPAKPETQEAGVGSALLGTPAAIAGDVARGVLTEIPSQATGGVIDAINTTLDFPTDLIEGVIGSIDPDAGMLAGRIIEGLQMPGLTGDLPTTDPADSVTGGIIRGLSQFLVPFGVASKALRASKTGKMLLKTGVKGEIATEAIAGGVTDILVFDPREERLSNFLNEFPGLHRPVTEFLAMDEDDPAIVGRLKQAIEGSGLGVATDLLFRGFRFYRSARKTRKAVEEDPTAAALRQTEERTADELRPPMTEEDLGLLGDPRIDLPEGVEARVGDLFIAKDGTGTGGFIVGADSPLAARYADAEARVKVLPTGDVAAGALADLPTIRIFRTPASMKPGEVNLFEGQSFTTKQDTLFHGTSPDLVADILSKGITRRVSSLDTLGESAVSVSPALEVAEQFGSVVFEIDTTGLGIRSEGLPLEEALERRLDQDIPLSRVRKVHIVLGRKESLDTQLAGSQTVGELVQTFQESGLEVGIARLADFRPRAPLTPEPVPPSPGKPRDRIYVNYKRIEQPDDVRAMIREMANEDAEAINVARGGEKQTFAEVEQLADDLGMTVDDLVGRQRGPMSGPQALAARKILNASAAQVATLAELASKHPESKNLYQFRRAVSVHYAIQAEVVAARTETARALASWRISADTDSLRAKLVEAALDTGSTDTLVLARRLVDLKDNPKAINKLTRKSEGGRLADAVFEYWVNGLLSSPKTHVVNMTSNAAMALWAVPRRFLAENISRALDDEAGVSAGEALALAYGQVKGIRDGFRMAAQAMRTGEPTSQLGKLDTHTNRAISSQLLGLEDPPASLVGKGGAAMLDYLGFVARMPTRLLQAEDEFFKAVAYRGELHAQAHRSATNAGLEGQAWADEVVRILDDPPDDIRELAFEAAHVNTFTNELGKYGKLVRGTRRLPGMRYVMPFVSTPTNILKYTFVNSPLGPLSKGIRADIKAGGARRATALAGIGMGSAVMMIGADMVMSGQLTGAGPADPKLRRSRTDQGIPPYSILLDGRWFRYSRLDPFGMWLGMSADIGEIMGHIDDTDEADQLATAGAIAFMQNMSNKTWVQGIFDVTEAVSNPQYRMGTFATRMLQSFAPMSSLTRAVRSTRDPLARQTETAPGDPLVENIKKKLPTVFEGDAVATALANMILSTKEKLGYPWVENAPLRYDMLGEQLDYGSHLGIAFDFLSPVGSRIEEKDPLKQAFLDHFVPVPWVPEHIGGVKLTAAELSTFERFAGRLLRQNLETYVRNPNFQRLPKGRNTYAGDQLKQSVTDSRLDAQIDVERLHPNLTRRIDRRDLRKQAELFGLGQTTTTTSATGQQ